MKQSNTDQALTEMSGQKIRIKKYAPKIDYFDEMQELRDENTRLCKLIDRYGVLVIMLVAGCVAALILGITIGRAL